MAVINGKENSSCIVLLGSHYDTKLIPGIRYVGANDSASSSALLMELARYLRSKSWKGECDLGIVWFDGEESILWDWSMGKRSHPARIQDNTYGSRHFVEKLQNCSKLGKKGKCLQKEYGQQQVIALILLDMVGHKNFKITRDRHSTTSLIQVLENVLNDLGQSKLFLKFSKPIEDDHIPFLRAGIASLNIIDFENIEYWHKDGDDVNKLSLDNIELAGELALKVAETVAKKPKEFLR